MFRSGDQEEVTRRQEPRDQYRWVWIREVEAEKIGIRDGKMHEALTFGEKERVSGQQCPGSEGVRVGGSWI